MTAAPKLANHMCEAALAYARHGLYVLPVWWIENGVCVCGTDCGRNAGKHPITAHGLNDATMDENTVCAWWKRWPTANVGIALAPSGLVAFDVDTPEAHEAFSVLEAAHPELAATPRQRSGSGNLHAIAKAPSFAIRGSLNGITLRGKNYIVAAPSVHKSGGRYEWITAPWDAPAIELPAALAERMRRDTAVIAAKPRTAPLDNEVMVKRARAWAAKAEPAIEGQHGESKLFYVCAKLVHGFGLSDSDALAVILDAYNPRCVPPWGDDEIDEVERKIREARRTCSDPKLLAPVENRELPSQRTDEPRPEDVDGRLPDLISTQPQEISPDGGDPPDLKTGSESDPISRTWIVPLDRFLGNEEPSDDDREDWNIRDVIPRGEPVLFAGPPKCGKTWAMLSIGIAAALGRSWLDHENTVEEPVRVLMLGYEDGLRRLRKRVWELCRALGTTPNDPVLREFLSISREPLRLPGDEIAFTAQLKAWKPQIVLIDNLTRVMAGDPNATKDAARFGNVWVKICGDVGCANGFLHHTAKVGPLAFAERNQGDPFDLVRGSGDFVAVARHVLLMRPIEAPGEHLSDVRMRGNLDLRRESFVLKFDRSEVDYKWNARLADLGDGDAVRARLATERKAKAEADKKAEFAVEFERRRGVALEILNAKGACSTAELAEAVGVKSPRTVANVFAALVQAGIVRADKVRGYVFADSDGVS